MRTGIKVLGLLVLIIGTMGVASAHYGPIWDGEKSEISGKVQEIYHMGFLLDNGKYVISPWWFTYRTGISEGDEVKIVGVIEDNAVFPYYIEVNGESYGDKSSEYPPWMDYSYRGGWGYWHCPMMW